MNRRTMQQDAEELQEALRDLAYEFAKAIGIIALVRRTPFLRFRSWVKDRENPFRENPHCVECGAQWEAGELGQPVVYHHPDCGYAGESGRNRTRGDTP